MPYSITGYRELKLRIQPGVLCCVILKNFREIYHTAEKKYCGKCSHDEIWHNNFIDNTEERGEGEVLKYEVQFILR